MHLSDSISVFGVSVELFQLIPTCAIVLTIPLTIIYIIAARMLHCYRKQKDIAQLLEKRDKKLFTIWFLNLGYWCCIHMYLISFIQLLFYTFLEIWTNFLLKLLWSYGYFWLIFGITILSIRSWKLYFYYNYYIVQIKQLWRKHLNSNKKYYSWFLNHTQFANSSYLIKIGIIYAEIIAILIFGVAIVTNIGMFEFTCLFNVKC